MALKTALVWGAVQTGLRMVLSFISIKVTAVFLGPSGLALVGQLVNFVSLVQGCLGNGIQTGVVKLSSEHGAGHERRIRVLRTGLWMSIFLVVPAALIIAVLAVPLSIWLFDTREYWPVMVLTGLGMVLVVARLPIEGSLNAHKRIRELSISQIVSTVAGAAFFIPFAWLFGVWGGLVGTVLAAIVAFPVVEFIFRRARIFSWRELWGNWDRGIAKEIVRFFPMLLANSAVAPLGLILIRNVLAADLGLHSAGYWQAIWRISDIYTMVLITSLSLYLMPHLSSCRDDKHFAQELFQISAKSMALTVVPALAIYFLRDVITAIVFTKEFSPVRELYGWQLVGDVLKMGSWPLRMALVIKHRAKWYISLEVVAPVLFTGLAHLLVPIFGINAATIGYTIAYAITDVLLLVALRDYLRLALSAGKERAV